MQCTEDSERINLSAEGYLRRSARSRKKARVCKLQNLAGPAYWDFIWRSDRRDDAPDQTDMQSNLGRNDLRRDHLLGKADCNLGGLASMDKHSLNDFDIIILAEIMFILGY